MSRSAFVLGGTGFVGSAIARRLAHAGWEVAVGSRGHIVIPGDLRAVCRHVKVDRDNDDQIKRALGAGHDLFVDVIPYESRDAEQVLDLKDLVGSVVAISTASVYRDDAGRTLDEARTPQDFPRLPDPIPETQATIAATDATYSAKKAAIEKILLSQNELPASVIRPCAVYGPGDTQCREWFFVKRALDRRPHVLLAHRGESVFHTTAVLNVAEMVRVVAEEPRTDVFNCGDPDPPDVRRIARSIAAAVGHEWAEIPIPAEQSHEPFMRNPWASPRPFVLDMSKARKVLGYEPVTTYEDAIVSTVEWIRRVASPADWKKALPQAADYLGERFDYAAEDAFVGAM